MFDKKLTLLFSIFVVVINLAQAQEEQKEQKEPQLWKSKGTFGFNMTQSSFTNWAAGGRNNISGLINVNAQADYRNDKVKWANLLVIGLGGIKYFNEGLQKTDDVFDIQSTYSYELHGPLNISGLGGFRTQFLEGFTSPTDTVRSSTFMAPGYGNTSIGLEYKPSSNFRLMLSPLSGKFTFVMDQKLANRGAFGVEEAELDDDGNILTPGRKFRPEIGSYARVIFTKEIMENVDFRTRWEFFSNYFEKPQNMDVNGELVINFKVNKWLSASLQANLIYDEDITITDRFGNTGPRTQFKQVLGIGLAYRVANFKEKED